MLWKVLRYFYRNVKTKTVIVRPDLILAKPVTTAPETTAQNEKAKNENAKTKFSTVQGFVRMFTTFAIFWASLILTVNYKPFLIFAVIVALIGAGKAIYTLGPSLRPSGVDKQSEGRHVYRDQAASTNIRMERDWFSGRGNKGGK